MIVVLMSVTELGNPSSARGVLRHQLLTDTDEGSVHHTPIRYQRKTEMHALKKPAEGLEASASAYCPQCEKRLTKNDHDGGRCTSCGSMLCAVDPAACETFLVRSRHGEMRVRAESQRLLERAIRGYGTIRYGATVEPTA